MADLNEKVAARGRGFGRRRVRRRPGMLRGFVLDRGRLAMPSEDFFEAEPARLGELFQLADLYGLEIHPLAMRAAARDAKLVDDIRREPRAKIRRAHV